MRTCWVCRRILLGLPGGDSMTYSNATQLFDFHDRRFLKPTAVHLMTALSNWALPRGQSVELNRDEYSRPPLKERAEAYEKLAALGATVFGGDPSHGASGGCGPEPVG